MVASNIWDKVFKSGPSKICGRQSLKNLKEYGLLKSSINFTWPTLEYFVPYINQLLDGSQNALSVSHTLASITFSQFCQYPGNFFSTEKLTLQIKYLKSELETINFFKLKYDHIAISQTFP